MSSNWLITKLKALPDYLTKTIHSVFCFVIAGLGSGSPAIRAKREGFVDLQALPTMMRGFAENLGRGFNSMVQQGQNLGHK